MIIEIIAYILALFVGVTLGLVGAGGSILTLPILVKVAGIEPKHATTYSLFIVGFTAMIGAINYYRKGSLHLYTAFVFLVPSAIIVGVIRRLLIPALPETLYEFETFELTTNKAIYILLSIVMIFASYNMLKKSTENIDNQDIKNIDFNYKLIFIQGIIIGTLTGLVGAGAGFLIVPSLVKFAKLPIRLTIGTSLMIITFNSFLGFTVDLGKINFDIDWSFLLIFSSIAGLGIFIGMYISNFINAKQLKVIFGIFVFIMAIYNIIKEIFGVIIL